MPYRKHADDSRLYNANSTDLLRLTAYRGTKAGRRVRHNCLRKKATDLGTLTSRKIPVIITNRCDTRRLGTDACCRRTQDTRTTVIKPIPPCSDYINTHCSPSPVNFSAPLLVQASQPSNSQTAFEDVTVVSPSPQVNSSPPAHTIPSTSSTGRQRHASLSPPQLNLATLNVHSLKKKVQGITDLFAKKGLGILCLTETWHEDHDDVPLRRLRSSGLQVLERARPLASPSVANSVNYTNHGGVAIVASVRIKLAKLSPTFNPQTFELLCVRATSCGASCIIAVVYRPSTDVITQVFCSELAKLLEYLMSFASPFVVTGDLNIRFDRHDDTATVNVNNLLTSYGASQHVQKPTHVRGGILDVIIAGDDCQPTDVTVYDPGLSDHSLVQWRFNLRLSSDPVYVDKKKRLWSNFDLASFRTALASSCLSDPAVMATLR